MATSHYSCHRRDRCEGIRRFATLWKDHIDIIIGRAPNHLFELIDFVLPFSSTFASWPCLTLHFNSIRGPSASSLGFSPVAGKCSASTAPKFRKAQIRSSGSHFWATSFSSKTEWFHFNGGTALRTPRSAITSILRSSNER